jgi:hypothetical protein
MPTSEMMRPSMVISSAAASERPASPTTRLSPSVISAKNSGGPNFSANCARGRATAVSASVANMPPMNEPIAAIASAAPARPWRAMA